MRARLWNLLPLPFERMAVRVEDGDGLLSAGGDVPLNKICDRRDWQNPAWRQAFEDLGYVFDPARLHRKEWEFAQGVYGLRRLRCLSPRAEALGLGCGHEPIIFFLAGRLRKVVATDLYAGEFSGREADPRILRDPEVFAPFAYPRDRLEVRRMDATAMDCADESFDLVFSFSALEHFGPRHAQRRTLAETRRVLRPGGIAVITTEIILNSWGRHGDYFRREELFDDLIARSGLQLVGGDFHFATGRATLDALVRLPEEADRLPHLVLRRWGTYFTSCALFLGKPVPAGLPPERCAPRDAEATVPLPPLLKARLIVVAGPAAVARGARYSVTCRVQNVGHARWRRSSPDGFGLVRLGAHLCAADGRELVEDYGRADLTRDLPPGGADTVTVELTAPHAPGEYRVELDMVLELVTWFSDREASSVLIPLTVT